MTTSEVKIEIKSYNDIKPPSFDIPLDQTEQFISNIAPFNLHSNSLTDPYLVADDLIPTKCDRCLFLLCRGPTYLIGFLWSLVSIFFSSIAYFLCCRKPYTVLSDEELTQSFQHKWPLTSFITKEKDEKDNTIFIFHAEEYGHLKDKVFKEYNIDSVKAVWDGDWTLQSIKIGKTTFRPEDEKLSNAWSMAKLYVMLAAHLKVRFGTHPYWHFVQHSYIHILNKIFNENHIFQLLVRPHMKHQAMIDNNVSISAGSVLNARNSTCCCWDLQITNRDGIQGIIRHNSRFYEPLMRRAPSDILQPYYQAIYKFVFSVISKDESLKSSEEKEKRKIWYKALHHYIGYPKDLDCNSLEDAAAVITQLIFSTSVLHSSEHYLCTQHELEAFPMTLSGEASKAFYFPSRCCSGRVVPKCDALKNIMYYNMFTRWWRNYLCCCFSDSRLITTTYEFEESDKELKDLANKFRLDLEEGEKLAMKMYPNYHFPLSECSRSIEF